MSEDRGHYRSLSVAAANIATTAAIAATHQEAQSPRTLRRLSRISFDEISEPVRSPVDGTDDEEYDEEVLSRLADSIQSEGSRSRKHVSWNNVSQARRSASIDPTAQHTFPSRRPPRPTIQMPDSREGEADIRGRPQQRGVDTEDGWGTSGGPNTPISARPSGSRAGRRSASLVLLGFWALFGVGTLVGSRRSLPSPLSVSIGRVLTPMDGPVPSAFDPSKVIKSDYEPEGFSLVEILEGENTGRPHPPPPGEGASLERIIGRMSAWACTTLYLTSRLPQIWKNVSTVINVVFPLDLRVTLVREEVGRGPLHVPFYLRFPRKHVLCFINSHFSETGHSWVRSFSIYQGEYSVSIRDSDSFMALHLTLPTVISWGVLEHSCSMSRSSPNPFSTGN